MSGIQGAVRQQALDTAALNAAEKHGKREDKTGKRRQVRDVPPLVYGSLDLAAEQAKWAEGVVQQGKTKALHMLIQYPTSIKLEGKKTEEREQMMLDHAVRFANQYHGGDAVFAASLDRDEAGRHTVDVFALPRYDFTYKDGRTQKRAAVSKFSKQHARARFKDLVDEGEDLKDPEGPIVQGRALQAAWHDYMRDEMGLFWVEPAKRKAVRVPDRLEPEEYALKRDKADAEAEALMLRAQAREDARAEADAIRANAKKQVVLALAEIEQRKADVAAREREVARDAAIVAESRRSMGRPDPDVEAVVERRRRRPDLQR